MNYYEKYLKYKLKYLNLKNILGGMPRRQKSKAEQQEKRNEDLEMLKKLGRQYLNKNNKISNVEFVKIVEKINLDNITFTKHGKERSEERLNDNQIKMDMGNPQIKKVMFTALYEGKKRAYIVLNSRVYVLGLDESDMSKTKFTLITTYTIKPTLKEQMKKKLRKKRGLKLW